MPEQLLVFGATFEQLFELLFEKLEQLVDSPNLWAK